MTLKCKHASRTTRLARIRHRARIIPIGAKSKRTYNLTGTSSPALTCPKSRSGSGSEAYRLVSSPPPSREDAIGLCAHTREPRALGERAQCAAIRPLRLALALRGTLRPLIGTRLAIARCLAVAAPAQSLLARAVLERARPSLEPSVGAWEGGRGGGG